MIKRHYKNENGISFFTIDTLESIKTLPKYNIKENSQALVLEDGSKYKLVGREWIKEG